MSGVNDDDPKGPAGNGDKRALLDGPPNDMDATCKAPWHVLLARAQDLFEQRRKRLAFFDTTMFGEPAWDMLLLVYIAETSHRYTSAQLADLSGTPSSTAMRWIDYLERQELVRRVEHPLDRRQFFVKLTGKGKAAVEAYLFSTLAAE